MYYILLTDQQIEDCSHSGACDDSTAHWAPKIIFPPTDVILRNLREAGAWDSTDLANTERNKQRILWIAACHCRENGVNEYPIS